MDKDLIAFDVFGKRAEMTAREARELARLIDIYFRWADRPRWAPLTKRNEPAEWELRC